MTTSAKQHEAMQQNYQPFLKPPPESGMTKFKRFLYNSETGAVFGRTGESWAKISLFYIIFYICLASMFLFLLWLFHFTLDPRIPKWKLDESLIGTNPGLGFRPMPESDNALSSLIWYKGTKKEDYQYWTSSLEKFLDPYRKPGLNPGRGQNIYNCDYEHPPSKGKVCNIDVRQWAPCTSENNYNYHVQNPCIFIKLNKIYGWTPEYYNDPSNLPAEMPESLKETIYQKANESIPSLNTIWVSCEGENPADVEFIGEIDYLPQQGFPGYFFPFENSEGYLSPLVAIHFKSPRTGVLINVECKAWAKNIKHDRKEKLGTVHFELMID
ncbi:hypothetical protein LSTR_LSTR009508 [Laodelphax striatellus]|uniref:Sodium/potassium-transporting ATPase subunit beta-2 n=1 Tax=Laodelphax striatellus TaxID=195883 RepID=A0A482WF87_LAOST|nr:hypothetical protein LSTR_LSTR009508 [Laodelphax striatellus]